MKSNYKRLGDYIHKVEKRNKDYKVTKLRGLSMTKEFRDTTSNIVGTDLSVYKVMSKWQFACDFMSVIRVHKFPVVLKTDDEPNLVSPAYPVFEVKDSKELYPEYLMMWFRRSEFDRFADFKCDSAIRGGFDWDALCDCMLPVPSIEKQLEIVKEYNTIQNRIKLNNRLITKLEETAQAIYKQWFVDFEFPDQNGKLYKSNGGEMVFCEELEKEIPEGWRSLPISEFCDVTFSKRIYQAEYSATGIPFYRSKEIILKKMGLNISNELYISNNRYMELINKFGAISEGDILLTAVGTIGVSYLITSKDNFYFKDGNLFWFKNFKKIGFNSMIYEWMQMKVFNETLEKITFGSTQKVITTTAVYLLNHVCPDDGVLNKFNLLVKSIHQNIESSRNYLSFMNELNDLLLSKMTKVESEILL